MGATTSDLSWHDVRDMPPQELADLMVRICGKGFEKYHQNVTDHAVGGGIVCSLDQEPLRKFLADIGITFKPQQDVIIGALDELKLKTETAIAALEQSGSPYTYTVVRALRAHNAAYVTFTKESWSEHGVQSLQGGMVGDTFRAATNFTKSLRQTIDSAWELPKTPVTVRLRGTGSPRDTHGPLLEEVAKSLNVVWLLSAGSLKDPFCLMEVCAAVRQGVPVLPIRLAGPGVPPLNVPIWNPVKQAGPNEQGEFTSPPKQDMNDSANNLHGRSGSKLAGVDNEPQPSAASRGTGGAVAQRAKVRALDAFYVQFSQGLPKPVQEELHRNRFVVKDVIAAVRTCFESVEDIGAGGLGAGAAESPTLTPSAGPRSLEAALSNPRSLPTVPAPPTFDLSAPSTDQDELLGQLVGVGPVKPGGGLDREVRVAQWNWENIPRMEKQGGRLRSKEAVPWRTDKEVSELIRAECAEADDLAGMLVKRMLANPGSEDHQWEGCKGLADLAARDSEGLSAVRRQGGIQAILAALAACSRDADVQRWGCEALTPLFDDPIIAAAHREAGVEAILRAFTVLQDVETALKKMKGREQRGATTSGQPTAARERWTRALKQIEVGRVKEQRRASLQKKTALEKELKAEEAELVMKIQATRKSFEMEAKGGKAASSASEAAAAALAAPDSSTEPGTQTTSSPQATKPEGEAFDGAGNKEGKKGPDPDRNDDDVTGEGLIEEQRRLEEENKLEHEARMVELDRLQANTPNPWAMTDADIAIYDAAFIKQDKDKDGFISPDEAKAMFSKARASKEATRHIWKMCDPHGRGKLTKHGWRVAYHLARCAKNRKLELPETLPQCLYPPGSEAGASRQTDSRARRPVGPGAAVISESGHGDDHKNKTRGQKQDGRTKTSDSVVTAKTTETPASPTKSDDSAYQMNQKEKARYDKAFDKLTKGAYGKNLGRKKAAAVLSKSGLGKKDLGHLWAIADADKDGELSRHEFSVAMHLVACAVSKAGLPLPSVLPSCLAVSQRVDEEEDVQGVSLADGINGTADAISVSTLGCPEGLDEGAARASDGEERGRKRQAEEGTDGREESVRYEARDSALEGKGSEYRMSERERVRYDKAFHKLVKGKSTYLGGKEAATVLTKSGLDKKELVNLWAIADADKDGQLSRQEFSVAMHLAACSTAKHLPLPTVLPECLANIVGAGHKKGRDNSGVGKNKSQQLSGPKASGPAKIRLLSAGDGGTTENSVRKTDEESTTGPSTKGSKLGVLAVPDVGGEDAGGGAMDAKQKPKKNLSREEKDQQYAMSTTERGGYDVVFMQIDADDSGKVDGRETAKLLGKSGLTREQLSAVWVMADSDEDGELTPSEWAVAMHLARCISQKHLPLPKYLPKSLGGSGDSRNPIHDSSQCESQPRGSKAKRAAEEARQKEKKAQAGHAIMLREQTAAYRLGKISASAFYITLSQVFGTRRHAMIPKVALSLPIDKARALVQVAGLGEEVLQENEAEEAKLLQLRRRRAEGANLHIKSTTSGATARDVQVVACRLANRLCDTLSDDGDGGGGGAGGASGRMAGKISVPAQLASAGGVATVALVFSMFGASDQELMVETLAFALGLTRGCAATFAALDDSVFRASSQDSTSTNGVAKEQVPEPSPLLPLLRTLYAPSICRSVSEVLQQFPQSKRVQRLGCLFIGELGSHCGAPARRCFAECCEPVVLAVAGNLIERFPSDSDESAIGVESGGGGALSPPERPSSSDRTQKISTTEGVRNAACKALAVLSQEPGLSRRLVAMGAVQAASDAMGAGSRDQEVQLSCLETLAMLVERNPGMWRGVGDGDAPVTTPAIDAPCRRVVQSLQTFARDRSVHRAASRAMLALLAGDSAGDAARTIGAVGGATALCRVLATSPTSGDVQLPAVLAIAKLLDDREHANTPHGRETSTAWPPLLIDENIEREFIASAGCELLCKSAKEFPRDRDLRLGCLRAMAALCRRGGAEAVERLVSAGVCEQIMKIVDAFVSDIEIRRAGLALVVGVAEHATGTSDAAIAEGADDQSSSTVSSGVGSSSAASCAVINRLGLVGAVAFAAAWLRETTTPSWAWGSVVYGSGDGGEALQDLLMACKASFLLARKSTTNRDRLITMGAAEALSRAVALSGRSNGLDGAAGNAVAAEERASVQGETQDWAAQAVAELARGHANEARCVTLARAGAERALFAAMARRPSARKLQRAGCITLGNMAACLAAHQPQALQLLGLNGGAKAVALALDACRGDESVAQAGLLAVTKLSVSAENRRLMGEAGSCRLVAQVLLEFSDREPIAEEGCRAVAGLAALSGFNRTALGRAGAAEAAAAALRIHPANPSVQRWGLSAAAALVADTDPSGNTARISSAGILNFAARGMTRFTHNPRLQVEGLRTFAKVATTGAEGIAAAWTAGVVIPTVRALGLYLDDGDIQHWGMATVRALTGSEEKCEAWRDAGAPEAVVRTLRAFGETGTGRRVRHDESGKGLLSAKRECTPDEALWIAFQACAAALHLANSSSDARRRLVREGAGRALAALMKGNLSNIAAQRGGLATLAALSSSGSENRRVLHRVKGGIPHAIVSALVAFPRDRRVRCEGLLVVQNLSFAASGARAMAKAGIAPVIVRLLQAVLADQTPAVDADDDRIGANKRQGEEEVADGDHLDRDALVYLLNGLANLAAADTALSDSVGKHGACQAVVSSLEKRPRDLQLQAAGVKAVRALAVNGGRNIDILATIGGATAVARAQGLFLRDREVQLACLGAAEMLCRGCGSRAIITALVVGGSMDLLKSAMDVFANDSDFVSQGLRTLVEMTSSQAASPPPLPALGLISHDGNRDLSPISVPAEDTTIDSHASWAVGLVLAVLERNPCREVCLSAFDALGRLLEIQHTARGLPPWANVGYAVRHALKLNRKDDADLASSGRRVLVLVNTARGRALAQ